jgi:hypothetical protein
MQIAASERDATSVMRHFPGPIELSASRTKAALRLGGFLVLGGGIAATALNSESAWSMIILAAFALGFLWTGFASELPLWLRGESLTLNSEGFTVIQPWHTTFTPWSDASDFGVEGLRLAIVAYDDRRMHGPLSRHIRKASGRTSTIPNTYGFSNVELALLLNQWRARALRTAP